MNHSPPAFEIVDERPHPAGLAFSVHIGDADLGRGIELHLNWADYNLWSPDGGDPPERVARAVVAEAVVRWPLPDLPDPLDAARLRRHWSDADAAIAARLRPRM